MYLKGVKFFTENAALFEGHLALIHHKSFCFISTHSHISLITRKEYPLEGVYRQMSHSKYIYKYLSDSNGFILVQTLSLIKYRNF